MSPLEEELLQIWREVLQHEKLGLHDSFTSCGGTPDLGGQLIERLEQRYGQVLHLPWLVAAPTVAQQAAWLQKRCLQQCLPAEGLADVARWREYWYQRFPLETPSRPETLNPSMIFVLSAARTGSTLLRVMLAGHPELFVPPELELLLFKTMRGRKQGLLEGWSDFLGLERACMELWGEDEPAARTRVAGWLGADLPTREVYRLLQLRCAPRRLVDKSPSYPLSLSALRRIDSWFERPLCLHLVRHPRPCIRSWTAGNFDQVVHAPPRQAAEMDWLFSNRHILQVFPPQRRHLVRYEELVTKPEGVMRGVCDFLGVAYHPALLQPYQGQRMTERLSGLVSGDKNFYRKSAIDPRGAAASRQLPGDGPLCPDTLTLAEQLGYPRDFQPPTVD